MCEWASSPCPPEKNRCLYQSLLNKRHLVVFWCFRSRPEMQICLSNPRWGMNHTMNSMVHTSDNLFCSNSSQILELSVKFASQTCHENTKKPLDGAYLADFGINISREENIRRDYKEAFTRQLFSWASLNFILWIICHFRGMNSNCWKLLCKSSFHLQ